LQACSQTKLKLDSIINLEESHLTLVFILVNRYSQLQFFKYKSGHSLMQANNILQFSQQNQVTKKNPGNTNKDYKVQNSMIPEGPLGDLIQYTNEWTNDAMSTLFDNVDTQLFEMAEKAENSTDQNTYFDAMRIIRLRRSVAYEEFVSNIAHNFSTSKLQQIPSDNQPADEENNDLSLVADDSLEEELATHNMVAKAERDNKEAIDQLQQRIAYLYNGLKIDSQNNPVGPTAFCDAFSQAANTLEAEIKVKLLVFKLFDINFITQLPELYAHLNKLLIEKNILPTLKANYKGVIKKQTASPVAAGIATNSIPQEIESNSDVSGLSQLMQHPGGATEQIAETQAFALIQQLLAQNKQMNNPSSQHLAQSDYATTDDVVASLSHLQFNGNENLNYNTNNTVYDSGATTSNLLKEALRQSLQNTQSKQGINQGDDDLIDVIGMLFDFILGDDHLVDSVKSLLSRLQIPIIKVALQDKNFFRNKNHPARRLLNELANAGLGITDSVNGQNNPLYLKLENIVSRIANEQEHSNEVSFFEDLLDDLHRFLHQFNHGINNKKTPSKQAALELIKTELNSRVEHKNLPHSIIMLLERVWHDVMFDIFFSDGMESDEWDMALTFVDTLIWSIDPKGDAQSQKQLVRVIPGILNALNAGLDRINYPKMPREQLLQDLQTCHLACMKGKSLNDTDYSQEHLSEYDATYVSTEQRHEQLQHDLKKASENPGELTPEELESIDAGVDILLGGDLSNLDALEEEDLLASLEDGSEEAISDLGEADLIEDSFTQQARNLTAGAWVEFKSPGNRNYRAKISWMSEDASAYIFVTQTGQIAEKSLQGLSESLRNNTATILDESPVFERAMDAVLEDLQEQIEH